MTSKTRGVAAGVIAAAILIATPMIGMFEGRREVGYWDIAGVPTYCYGGTGENAVVGKRYTAAACETQRATDVLRHADAIAPCVPADVPVASFAAFISFSYNVGAAAFCRSSIARNLNAGNLRAACTGLSQWVWAGKPPRVVPGLAKRRAQERAQCEKGLT